MGKHPPWRLEESPALAASRSKTVTIQHNCCDNSLPSSLRVGGEGVSRKESASQCQSPPASVSQHDYVITLARRESHLGAAAAGLTCSLASRLSRLAPASMGGAITGSSRKGDGGRRSDPIKKQFHPTTKVNDKLVYCCCALVPFVRHVMAARPVPFLAKSSETTDLTAGNTCIC